MPTRVSNSGGAVLPQPDRETLKQLKDARHLIQKERYGEAVRILGNILSLPGDSFFPTKDPKQKGVVQIRGLREETEQILGSLPRRGLDLYELQFGSEARQLLKKAMREGNTRVASDISRRFFYTKAGAEATWLAGLAAMDEGRWKGAVLLFERFKKRPLVSNRYEPLLSIFKAICMEQVGEHELAKKTWNVLRERNSKASIQVAGKTVPLFIDPKETFSKFLERTNLETLGKSGHLLTSVVTDQILPHGTPQRNPSVDAGLPLLKRLWRTRITDRPTVETMLRKQREKYIDNGTITIPRFYPLVIDGVLFGRTLQTLVAVDAATGKRLWESSLDGAAKRNQGAKAYSHNQSSFFQHLMSQILGNSIFGQISSDTRYIYAIEDANFLDKHGNVKWRQVFVPGMAGGMVRMSNNQAEGLTNFLVAYDAKTGRQRWKRSTGVDGTGPLFFLGPPLPLDGFLYALAQSQGEIQLVVLSAASGEIEWSQRIAVVEPTSRGYGRQQGVSVMMPAVADGVMICPTGNGAIVAVEPTSRALLWAHCYEQFNRNHHHVVFVNGAPQQRNQNRIGEELILHDGFVFSAPIDSSYLYCLDLNTGKELWKKSINDGAFFGGVYRDRLLMIGSHKIQTFSTKNGKRLDSCDLKKALGRKESVFVTGRGFRNEGLYYVPTSSSHIVAIDIEHCKVVQKTGTHESLILGNLVAVGDRIFSQSFDGLEAFHQLKSIRAKTEKQLQENPKDLAAITMQGELLLAEEKLDEAIEKFRYVHRTEPTLSSGDRLFRAFCIGLEESYPEYRGLRPEIESLLRTPGQKSKYWYYVVLGESAENDQEAAADACFRLAELSDQSQAMFSKDRCHTVRQDRFVQAELTSIYQNSDEATQEKLSKKILAQFNLALQSGNRMTIYGVWNCYASLPPIVERYGQIIEKMWSIDPVFAELILERTIRFGSPSEATTAMVQWAELLRKSGRLDDSAACYREAIHRWQDVPLLNSEQTAQTRVASMQPTDPVRRRIEGRTSWPQGYKLKKPEKVVGSNSSRMHNFYSRSRMIQLGIASPIFRNKKIVLTGKKVILQDEYNRKVWEVSLGDGNDSVSVYYGQQNGRCSTVGHMIFLESKSRLCAIDAWDPDDPKVVWKFDRGLDVYMPGMQSVSSNFQQAYFSGYTNNRYGNNRRMLGIPGLDFGFQLFTISGTELIAIDPIDGSPVWRQRKLPNQVDFNSDGTTLFISQAHRRNELPITMRLIDGSREVSTSKRRISKVTSKGVKPKKVPPGNAKERQKKEEAARKAGEIAARIFMKSARRKSTRIQKVLPLGRNMLAFSQVSSKHCFSLVDSVNYKPVWGSKKFSNQSRWRLLDQDYVGVVEPNGNLEVFRIVDGKVIVQRKLKLDGTLQGVYLQNLGDRFAVIVSTRPKSNVMGNSSYLPIVEYIQQGRIYTFHWDGRPAIKGGSKGILFERLGILADVPEQLPVITLMSQERNANKPKNPCTTKIQVLDSRTGKEIFSKKLSESIQSFELSGNPEEKTVEYQLNSKKYTIQFE